MAKSSVHRHDFNRRSLAKRPLRPVSPVEGRDKARPFGVSYKTLGLFYESMGQMMASGTALDVALLTFAAHSELGEPAKDIQQRIYAGVSLADAMAYHRAVFPAGDILRIAQAESAGGLDIAFGKLVEQTALQMEFRAAFVKTLRPAMKNVFGAFILLPVGQLFTGKIGLFAYALPIAVCFIVFGAAMFLSTMTQPLRWLPQAVAESLAAGLARLPGLRSVFLAHLRYRLCESMHLTMSSGVSLALGIPLALRSITIPAWRDAMAARLEAVLHGATVSECFAASGLFDQRDLVRITSGETAGKLDQAFAEIAKDANAAFVQRLRFLGRVFSSVLGAVVVGWIGYSIISQFVARLESLG